MDTDQISVISIQDTSSNEEPEEKEKRIENLPEDSTSSPWNILHVFSILAVATIILTPSTLIPRANSILYQSNWFEVNIFVAIQYLVIAANEIINTSTYFKEKALKSWQIFLRMYLFNMALWIVPYLVYYYIWCIQYEYNWPMPFVGYHFLFTKFGFVVGMWYILPRDLRSKEGLKRNVQLYILYQFLTLTSICFKEVISVLFKTLPSYLQWIVAFVIPALKHLDKLLLSKVINKMTGGLDEACNFLLALAVNSGYSCFVAVKLPGAERATVCFIILVDLALQLQMTYKIFRLCTNVTDETSKNGTMERQKIVKKLVLAEIIETLTPLVYAAGFAMAFYGPSASLFIDIKSNYWGSKAVEDPEYLFLIMVILFGFDMLSVLINSFILRNWTSVNLYQEFCKIMERYWPII